MFVDRGFDNWKKALHRFRQHEQSGSHKEAVLSLQLLIKAGKRRLSSQYARIIRSKISPRNAFETIVVVEIPVETRTSYSRS